MHKIIFASKDKQLRGVIIGKRGSKIRELKEKYGCDIVTNDDGFIISSDDQSKILECNSEMMRIQSSLIRSQKKFTKNSTKTYKPKATTKITPVLETSSTFDVFDSSSEYEEDEGYLETKTEPRKSSGALSEIDMAEHLKSIISKLAIEADKEFDDPNAFEPIPEGVLWSDLF